MTKMIVCMAWATNYQTKLIVCMARGASYSIKVILCMAWGGLVWLGVASGWLGVGD